jgi:hypothetical protein
VYNLSELELERMNERTDERQAQEGRTHSRLQERSIEYRLKSYLLALTSDREVRARPRRALELRQCRGDRDQGAEC